MANKELSEKLKRLRTATGLSQDKVAKSFGFKKSTLGSWECGVSEPDSATLMRLLHFYGVQNVYSVFNMTTPVEKKDETLDQLNRLNPENRRFIDALINKLLCLQDFESQAL